MLWGVVREVLSLQYIILQIIPPRSVLFPREHDRRLRISRFALLACICAAKILLLTFLFNLQ
jgi:hypothetical protein